MEEKAEYSKLPLEERCVHQSWKARLNGYEECVKKFQCIDDEKSPEWKKFLGWLKKFVVDIHPVAQEKGLEATLAFVKKAACAGRCVRDVMTGIVNKCVAAPKVTTKSIGVQVILMFIEIERQNLVQKELMKGTEAKNPKIVSACIAALTMSLREFGPKVINVNPLMNKLAGFLGDRDKTVREEGKSMVVEIYRWIGDPLKYQLGNLKPVMITKLYVEFGKLSDTRASPTRYLRSQKPKAIGGMGETSSGVGGGDGIDNDNELIEPVDILSKLPKDFFDKLEAKKWQERKEALEALELLTKNPKLESGEYGDVVRALKKIISKDANVVVVALAVKCLTGLAVGLKKRFQTYATACLPGLLEKFREKKSKVVATLREAADAIFSSITIEMILEDSIVALENKNPSVKAETAGFLARCFATTPPSSFNKKLLKAYVEALLKTLNEPNPTVRDNSAEALGTAMKLVGEESMLPFLTDVHALKMSKIKECADKVVIRKTERPSTAPAKIPIDLKSRDGKTQRVDETQQPKGVKSGGGAVKASKIVVKSKGAAGGATTKPGGARKKDNSVRNAALNCIEQAYYYEGEQIFELIGQISAFNVVTQPTDVSPICPDELEPTSATVENIREKALSIDDNVKTRFHKTSDLPARSNIPDLVEIIRDPEDPVITLNPPRITLLSLTPPKLAPSRNDLRSLQTTPPTRDRELERTIFSMANGDLPIAIQSMIAIETLIKSQHVTMMQTKEDKFIGCVNMQLKLLQTYRLESDGVFECFQTALSVTFCFYDSGVLGKNVPPMRLQELVHQMITLLAENELESLKQSEAYRVINNTVVKIIDNSNHTSIICVLIKLLHGCAESRELPKYEELVMKCLWKIVKTISNWAGDLDYDTILLEVHLFFKDYPSSWWKKRNSDMPLRTIKSVLDSITKVKGSTILSHMTKIHNTQDSELQSFLDRLIARLRNGPKLEDKHEST